MKMSEVSVRIRTPPSLGFWPKLGLSVATPWVPSWCIVGGVGRLRWLRRGSPCVLVVVQGAFPKIIWGVFPSSLCKLLLHCVLLVPLLGPHKTQVMRVMQNKDRICLKLNSP